MKRRTTYVKPGLGFPTKLTVGIGAAVVIGGTLALIHPTPAQSPDITPTPTLWSYGQELDADGRDNYTAPMWYGDLEPCAQEDSDNCYWDAGTRGNGRGTDFTVRDGQYTYYETH